MDSTKITFRTHPAQPLQTFNVDIENGKSFLAYAAGVFLFYGHQTEVFVPWHNVESIDHFSGGGVNSLRDYFSDVR